MECVETCDDRRQRDDACAFVVDIHSAYHIPFDAAVVVAAGDDVGLVGPVGPVDVVAVVAISFDAFFEPERMQPVVEQESGNHRSSDVDVAAADAFVAVEELFVVGDGVELVELVEPEEAVVVSDAPSFASLHAVAVATIASFVVAVVVGVVAVELELVELVVKLR